MIHIHFLQQDRGVDFFNKIVIADPYPYWPFIEQFYGPNTEMKYNLSNWASAGDYETVIAPSLENLEITINNAGGIASAVSLSHEEILIDMLNTTIG